MRGRWMIAELITQKSYKCCGALNVFKNECQFARLKVELKKIVRN